MSAEAEATRVGTLVIATGNPGKVKEFRALLAPGRVTLLTPEDIGFTGDVKETGQSFGENALLKARALAGLTAFPVLSDDSGLEVEALGGAPGLHTARFAVSGEAIPGTHGVWDSPGGGQARANRAKLLHALEGAQNRKARFVCTLCYLPGSGEGPVEPVFFEGFCRGEIAREERGRGGFGYDSLFLPLGFDRTFAELPEAVKDGLSHRGQAVKLFLDFRRSA